MDFFNDWRSSRLLSDWNIEQSTQPLWASFSSFSKVSEDVAGGTRHIYIYH